MNTHYSGRLEKAVNKKIEDAPQAFYDIFTKYDFYDVADPNNSLTDIQRRQVPEQNQTRYTQFSYALTEMFLYMLGGNSGLFTKHAQELVDKLDARSSANASQLQSLSTSLATVPGMNALAGAMKSAESMTAAAMGTNPYNPDMIPPFSPGMPGLPSGISNTYSAGFFQPNWNFLYDNELTKKSKIYVSGNKLYIGAGIPLTGMPEISLKKIFGVNGVDKKTLAPTGDLSGGLDVDEFKVILSASKALSTEFDSFVNNSLTLNDSQMRSSFTRYVNIAMWEPISSPTNWLNGHWGALANNSCPEPVKTAVCSYIWTQGMSLDPKRDDVLALISYLLSIGVYYTIGYQYNIKMTWLNGVDISPTPINSNGVLPKGVKQSKEIANKYFTWIADVIARTVNKSLDKTIGKALRKRRVAEANLIYTYVGLSPISFGNSVSTLPPEHTINGLKSRKFNLIAKSGFQFYRYKNEGIVGGETPKSALATPTSLSAKLWFTSTADPKPMSVSIMNYIRALMDISGVKSAAVTSTIRTSVDQVRAMYGNLTQYGNTLKYGVGGTNVIKTYYANKGKPEAQVKAAMVKTCEEQPPFRVSRHCANMNERVVFDIGPNSIQPQSARSSFEAVLRAEMSKKKVILKVLTPKNDDPAFHIEIDPHALGDYPVAVNAEMPTVLFTLTNTTLISEDAWNAPFSSDAID